MKVEWGEQPYQPSEEEKTKIKAVHVGNLGSKVSLYQLRSTFEAYGRLFHVQKVRDYAFVHYDNREDALSGMTHGMFYLYTDLLFLSLISKLIRNTTLLY